MATLKNTTINDTGYLQVPVGTTAQRPGSPQGGMVRYNTSTDSLEWYSSVSSVWVSEPGGLGTLNNPAESAAAIAAVKSNATNGFYYIRQTGSVAYLTYCVFTTLSGVAIQGGPWTVPFVFNIPNSNFSTSAATSFAYYQGLCQSIGINTPGRGMESTRTTTEVYGAWLAAKRAIWEGYTNFVSGKSSGSGGVLTMPMLNANGEGGSSAQRLVYNSSLSTHLPPNYDGDACNSNQLFCGWWGSNDIASWATNNDTIPGPEDWGPTTPTTGSTNTTYGYTGFTPQAICCVYK